MNYNTSNSNNFSEQQKVILDRIIDSLVESVVAERPHTQLEKEEHYRLRLKSQLVSSLGEYQKMMVDAINTLQKQTQWPLAERLQQLSEKLSEESFWQQDDNTDTTVQDFLGLSDEELISFYNVGSNLYQSGSYQEACSIFTLLTQLNPKVAQFWMALGIIQEKLDQHESAVYAYLLSAELDEASLTCYLQAAKCLLLLDQSEKAKKMLQHALERINENPTLKPDQVKVERMLNAIGKIRRKI